MCYHTELLGGDRFGFWDDPKAKHPDDYSRLVTSADDS
jgi:hypothetical protein